MATCEQCIYVCKKRQNSTSKGSQSRAPLFHFLPHHLLVIFSPHPPDGGLDHKLSFILCSLIINKKILATRAFLTWKENLCFTSGLCLRTSTKWMSTRQTVLISVFWHHFHKTCWSSWCRCLVRHICWGWLENLALNFVKFSERWGCIILLRILHYINTWMGIFCNKINMKWCSTKKNS